MTDMDEDRLKKIVEIQQMTSSILQELAKNADKELLKKVNEIVEKTESLMKTFPLSQKQWIESLEEQGISGGSPVKLPHPPKSIE